MTVGSGPVSRRQALGLAAVFGVGLLGLDAAKAENEEFKEELKEELGTIDYEEALTDVGPDSVAELNVREKKQEDTPDYVAVQKEIEEESVQKFESMVESEAEQAAKLRAKFGKFNK